LMLLLCLRSVARMLAMMTCNSADPITARQQ
jgi:hypothetical protein